MSVGTSMWSSPTVIPKSVANPRSPLAYPRPIARNFQPPDRRYTRIQGRQINRHRFGAARAADLFGVVPDVPRGMVGLVVEHEVVVAADRVPLSGLSAEFRSIVKDCGAVANFPFTLRLIPGQWGWPGRWQVTQTIA